MSPLEEGEQFSIADCDRFRLFGLGMLAAQT